MQAHGSSFTRKIAQLSLAVILCIASPCPPGFTQAERNDQGVLVRELKLPVYEWSDKTKNEQGVVIAIHGLMKHGAAYDKLGGYLADKGYVVVAQDLRGYGRWHDDKGNFKGGDKVSYEKSYEDLVNLAARMRSLYPNRPMFCIGESLGADLALHLAGVRPDLTDGLILSSPAIAHHHSLCKQMVVDAAKFCTNPGRELNMEPYIKSYTSDDPRITDEALKDPLTRRSLSLKALLGSRKTMKETLAYVRSIPPHIPVLIIQGSADKIIKADGIVDLMTNLKSKDQTVRWLDSRGHVLLETAFINDNTLEAISGWLTQHMPQTQVKGVIFKSASKPNSSSSKKLGS
ncbi:MAG: lysophospholipase [Candidatus Obscuribacterales bacterium]|nr:lysophospholipase [Candidatus Obscuribacterales bacterium]